jgi:hypothetical protein
MQPQLQTIKVHGNTLTKPKNIRTELRNYFEDFYSTKGNKSDIKDDTFSNMPSLDNEEKKKCDASFTLTELTTVLENANSG